MRMSHQCPKCQSDQISKIKGSAWNSVYDFIMIGSFSKAYPTTYVCTDCGFFEKYIENQKDLVKIKKKYGVVPKFDDFV